MVRALQAAGYRPRHAIEIVDFLAEEPSEYGVSCVGSRAMAGALDGKLLAFTGPGGESSPTPSSGSAAIRTSLRTRAARTLPILELHIEQGAVLQNRKIDLGLVTGIVGITRLEVVFDGSADHAGTTPMDPAAMPPWRPPNSPCSSPSARDNRAPRPRPFRRHHRDSTSAPMPPTSCPDRRAWCSTSVPKMPR